ncbi:MAG: hypothetical protein P8Z49_07765 [Acidobacteriota bacterium]
MTKLNLGDLLLEANLIDPVQLKIALEEQKRRGTKIGSTLVDLHFVDENVLSAFLGRQLDIPCIALTNIEVPLDVRAVFPAAFAHRFEAVPVKIEGGRLHLAMVDPMDMKAIVAIENATGLEVLPMVAPQSSIRQCLDKLYVLPRDAGDGEKEPPAVFPELNREVEEAEVFGRHFMEIHDQLDRLERKINVLYRLLEKHLDQS